MPILLNDLTAEQLHEHCAPRRGAATGATKSMRRWCGGAGFRRRPSAASPANCSKRWHDAPPYPG